MGLRPNPLWFLRKTFFYFGLHRRGHHADGPILRTPLASANPSMVCEPTRLSYPRRKNP